MREHKGDQFVDLTLAVDIQGGLFIERNYQITYVRRDEFCTFHNMSPFVFDPW